MKFTQCFKYFLTIAVLGISCTSMFSQFNETTELKLGIHYLYGDKVRMRSSPSLDGPVIYTLTIATPINVIGITKLKSTINGEEDYWYKVKYDDKDGYIWGGLIADNSFKYNLDDDSIQEHLLILNLTKDPNLGYKKNNVLKLKLIKQGVLVNELVEGSSSGIDIRSINFVSWKEFSTPLNLVDINYEFNGEVGGSTELFLRFEKGKLTTVFSYQHGYGEGGYSCENDAIFPNEPGGKPNMIIIKSKCAEVSECDDTPENPCKWEYHEYEYRWNGTVFEPN